MRFSLPIFALTAATSAAVMTNQCAICRDTIPPGPPEVSWALVWKDEIAENVTLCGYHGKSHRNPNNTATTLCEYTTNTDGQARTVQLSYYVDTGKGWHAKVRFVIISVYQRVDHEYVYIFRDPNV
ncbi:hypothetical protein C8R43DRAFT_947212 [Mycena crocata]|nr:hypothetical protein C8R43DRAFT_947212 [Mycena crocata]